MPFVDGSAVSIPSLRRRMVWAACEGVEKYPPDSGSEKRLFWESTKEILVWYEGKEG